MSKFIAVVAIFSILFTPETAISREKRTETRDAELQHLKRTLFEARKRIRSAGTYRWNDALRFLPTVTMGRRAPYDQFNAPTNETYLSASISFNGLFELTEIANRKAAEKRKAARRVESLGFSIEKLLERKHLLDDQIAKMKKIVRSIEEPLEAANKQETIYALEVRKNETAIEIEKLFAEIEYVCVEVEN